jgi:methyl-accepting chemotaxis protein
MPPIRLEQLPLQVYVFAGILAFLFIVFLVFFLTRGVLLRATLGRLAKTIRNMEGGDSDPAPLFDRDSALKHLWQEFRKTLHEQRELNMRTGQMEIVALRPTVPAEVFFNTQVLVDNRLRTEFFKHLPGVFTGVGIIGTFTGLIQGLQAFQVSEAPTIVRESLNGLLHGVWLAFLVSALAITLAMVVTLIEKLLLASLYRKVEELNQALDSRLQAGAGEEYLSRLVKASEEGTAQTKILKDALVADLKQVLSDLTERQIAAMAAGNSSLGQSIGAHIQTSLQRPLEEIARATGGLREDQGSAVTKLLTDVMAGFSERLQELFGGQITGINQLQQQTIQALQAAVARLEQMASDVQSSGTKAADAMADRLAEAMTNMEARQTVLNRQTGEFLESMRALARDSQAQADHNRNEALGAFSTKMTEMISALQEQSARAAASHSDREERAAQRSEESLTKMGAHVDDVLSAVSRASTEMANSVTALRTVTTTALDKMNSGAETLFVAASDFAKAGQGVSSVLTQATAATGQLNQAAGSVAAASRSLDGSMAEYKTTRDVIARMVTELQTIVEAAKKEASLTADVLQRIEAAAAKLGRAQADADTYLERISEVLTEAHASFTKNLQSSLTKANSDFYTELSRATKLLSDGIRELESTLGDVAVRV